VSVTFVSALTPGKVLEMSFISRIGVDPVMGAPLKVLHRSGTDLLAFSQSVMLIERLDEQVLWLP
jgi:hypothetical protein